MPRRSPPMFLVCALAWAIAACSSSDSTDGAPAAPADDGGAPGDATSSPADGATGSHDPDAAVDAAPPAVSCKAGDRTEWSGTVASTGVAVAVCSLCGKSYVVASNGTSAAGQVTIDNGTKSVTLDVPAGGTATSASLADRAADGAVTVCATGTSHACLPMDPPNQRYCDPYRDVGGLTPQRIDQGVDYGGAGRIYAMGPGKIDLYYDRNDSGWPGGTFVSYKLTAGPAAGRVIYLAENIDLDPSLKAGSFVYGGTVLGTMVNASPYTESGWGVAGAGYTAEHSCYTEGCMTPLGENFDALLVCLGTPSGVKGTGGCCSQPSGWPSDWCAELATWQ